MHAAISTVAFRGIDTIPVEVQVHIANGLQAMAIVGLADKAVAEPRERERAALGSIRLALPPKCITMNLAPADVVKEGAYFDLPAALGLLVVMEAVGPDAVANTLVLGELSLHGVIEAVFGVLPAAMAAVAAAFADQLPVPPAERETHEDSCLSPENLSASARQLLELAVEKQALTARGFHRVLRVARTIANLAQSLTVDRPPLAEALGYRTMPLLA